MTPPLMRLGSVTTPGTFAMGLSLARVGRPIIATAADWAIGVGPAGPPPYPLPIAALGGEPEGGERRGVGDAGHRQTPKPLTGGKRNFGSPAQCARAATP